MTGAADSVSSSQTHVKLSRGAVVNDRWEVVSRLGEGGCGVVYEVVDRQQRDRHAALKVEPLQPKKEDEILKMEVFVLRKLVHVCRLLMCGKTSTYSYMVMSLVGENLSDMRRKTPKQCFTLSTTIRVALQAQRGIHDVHKGGFVHRDVKPANFSMGHEEPNKRTVFILDFGLSRRFVIRNKAGRQEVRQERRDVPFRGTIRYCSLNTHLRKDQGRGDDVQSWLYMTIEMLRGELPWRSGLSRKQVQDIKAEIGPDKLCEGCPQQFAQMQTHIKKLAYKDEPDYALLQKLLLAVMKQKQITNGEPYDWEPNGRYHEAFTKRPNEDGESTEERNIREESLTGSQDLTERDADDLIRTAEP